MDLAVCWQLLTGQKAVNMVRLGLSVFISIDDIKALR